MLTRPCIYSLSLATIAISLTPLDTMAFCTPDDIQSTNVERCAKAHSTALRKCLRKGISFDRCPFGIDVHPCSLLPADCAYKVTEEITAIAAVVYDYGAAPDPCHTDILKKALKLFTKTLARKRSGRLGSKKTDIIKLFEKRLKCDTTPDLNVPCVESASPKESLACVLQRASGCSTLSIAEIEPFAGPTLTLAAALGYVVEPKPLRCQDFTTDQTAVVALMTAQSRPLPQSTAFFYQAESGPSVPLLTFLDAQNQINIVNSDGGVAISPDGSSNSVQVGAFGDQAPRTVALNQTAGEATCGDYWLPQACGQIEALKELYGCLADALTASGSGGIGVVKVNWRNVMELCGLKKFVEGYECETPRPSEGRRCTPLFQPEGICWSGTCRGGLCIAERDPTAARISFYSDWWICRCSCPLVPSFPEDNVWLRLESESTTWRVESPTIAFPDQQCVAPGNIGPFDLFSDGAVDGSFGCPRFIQSIATTFAASPGASYQIRLDFDDAINEWILRISP